MSKVAGTASFQDKYNNVGLEESFAQVPNTLSRHQGELFGRNHLWTGIVLALMSYKYGRDDPWISVSTIAEHLRRSVRCVQTNLKDMKAAGLLTIKYRRIGPGLNATNLYDLTPLFLKLKAIEDRIKAEKGQKVQDQAPAKPATVHVPEPAPPQVMAEPLQTVPVPAPAVVPDAELAGLDEIGQRIRAFHDRKDPDDPSSLIIAPRNPGPPVVERTIDPAVAALIEVGQRRAKTAVSVAEIPGKLHELVGVYAQDVGVRAPKIPVPAASESVLRVLHRYRQTVGVDDPWVTEQDLYSLASWFVDGSPHLAAVARA